MFIRKRARRGSETIADYEIYLIDRLIESLSRVSPEMAEVAALLVDEDLDLTTLKNLTLDDLREMGVARFGTRIRARTAIDQCLSMPSSSECPPDLSQFSDNVRQLFGARRVAADRKAEGLLLRQKTYHEVEHTKVTVPVFQTIMCKKFHEGENEQDLRMVATMIQRVLFYDLSSVKRAHVSSAIKKHWEQSFFDVRINEGQSSADSVLTPRKTAVTSIDIDLEARPDARPSSKKTTHSFPCLTSTISMDVPMVQYSVYEEHPFRIVACEVLIELASFVGTSAGNSADTYEFRPDLVCPLGDQRDLVGMRDWDKPDIYDEMRNFDPINTSPVVEFQVEGKKDELYGDLLKDPFVPKVRLTWYMTSNYTQPFLETVAPIGFLNLCNLLNMLYCQVYDDFMSNLLSVGLTMVVIIPSFRGQGYFTPKFVLNHFYLLLLFLGISVSILGFDHGSAHGGAPAFWAHTANTILWGAFTIATVNFMRYQIFVAAIKKAMPYAATEHTFNGVPRTKASATDPSKLRHFYALESGQHYRACGHNAVQVVPNLDRPEFNTFELLWYVITGEGSGGTKKLLGLRRHQWGQEEGLSSGDR